MLQFLTEIFIHIIVNYWHYLDCCINAWYSNGVIPETPKTLTNQSQTDNAKSVSRLLSRPQHTRNKSMHACARENSWASAPACETHMFGTAHAWLARYEWLVYDIPWAACLHRACFAVLAANYPPGRTPTPSRIFLIGHKPDTD